MARMAEGTPLVAAHQPGASAFPSDDADIFAQQPNIGSANDGVAEADTCRICRGEATVQEPLFYPCKCSGSIKYVHQDCLLEWLSHSQKKHCELCKTTFRFTKLYSQDMPPRLPGQVFARHVVLQTFRAFATWARFCLVGLVWFGCLPWIMRHIWSLLFWLGEGGWVFRQLETTAIATDLISRSVNSQQMTDNMSGIEALSLSGTSPVTAPFVLPTCSITNNVAMEDVSSLSGAFNMLRVGALPLLGSVYPGLSSNGITILSKTANSSGIFVAGTQHFANYSSLLGDYQILRNLTRSSRLNTILITTMEGQIITIVLVVCFVLIFLIREWVVQQQPGINMGAGFNPNVAAQLEQGGDALLEPIIDNHIANRLLVAGEPVQAQNEEEWRAPLRERDRPIAQPRRRLVRFDEQQATDDEQPLLHEEPAHTLRTDVTNANVIEKGERVQRPGMPTRDTSPTATDIQRHLTENVSPPVDKYGTSDFVTIWRKADGDRAEILRIIESEGLGDKMKYWVHVLQTQPRDALADLSPALATAQVTSDASSTSKHPDNLPHGQMMKNKIKYATSMGDGGADLSQRTSNRPAEASDKGKEKDASNANIPEPEEAVPFTTTSAPQSSTKPVAKSPGEHVFSQSEHTRPRATSDGPYFRRGISLLANDSWTFSGIPLEDEEIVDVGDSIADEQSWKAEQDLRVFTAVLKARAARSESQGEHVDAASNPFSIPEVTETIDLEGASEGAVAGPDTINHHDEADIPSDGRTITRDDSLDDELDHANNPEPNLRQNDALPDHNANQPQGVVESIYNWLWGDMDVPQDDQMLDDEHLVEDIAAEAPFVPVQNAVEENEFVELGGDLERPGQDREVLAAARAAGIDPNDPDVMDDVEDFDGFMEIIGMRGPLTGLIQNCIFSIVLVSLSVAGAVWLPYILGRLILLLIANPMQTAKLPLRILFSCAALVQDFSLLMIGGLSYAFLAYVVIPLKIVFYPTAQIASGPNLHGSVTSAVHMSFAAGERVAEGLFNAMVILPDTEIPIFSAASHKALLDLQNGAALILSATASFATSLFIPPPGGWTSNHESLSVLKSMLKDFGHQVWVLVSETLSQLARPNSWLLDLRAPVSAPSIDPSLYYWTGTDRFCAILAGYMTLGLLGALYLRRGSPFSSTPATQSWEATIIDLLHQAGGVVKVILIISIEMLVFPLYCGLLLDVALLPLFDNATLLSRIMFTFETPLTSIFVHWFVGTCYMFHFALFVSMCRKIMRSGVLYFIRDPDDPNFHPVRDVLERNISTQLRKITFSAMVYGALVLVCLGSVVWGLAYAFSSVLPIHWSSNDPVLEFPVDLLFYNFFMPLAVKFFKPSDGLRTMYAWWFRKCARTLRLTWFLFDERMIDEESHKDMRALFQPARTLAPKDGSETPSEPQFVRDGRYVRTPASDQVRLPKGSNVFLEVDDQNRRLDGVEDKEEGTHGRSSDLFKMVYVPPHFRTRIFLFILFIWFFAATTGVGFTIIPLVLGRFIFAKAIPAHVRRNDVYAFSIGAYLLGGALYCLLHLRDSYEYCKRIGGLKTELPVILFHRVVAIGCWVLRLIFVYGACALVLPALFALVVEFYFIVPLHTYIDVDEPHVIHFVQSWTLGLLYVKLSSRLILWYENSRPAEALRAVTAHGYWDPDIRIATRCFILPAACLLSLALLLPFGLAVLAVKADVFGILDNARSQMLLYRYAYPMFLALVLISWALKKLWDVLQGWRMRIRDEVYLIGERLHNFGDKGKSAAGGFVPSSNRVEA